MLYNFRVQKLNLFNFVLALSSAGVGSGRRRRGEMIKIGGFYLYCAAFEDGKSDPRIYRKLRWYICCSGWGRRALGLWVRIIADRREVGVGSPLTSCYKSNGFSFLPIIRFAEQFIAAAPILSIRAFNLTLSTYLPTYLPTRIFSTHNP